MFVIKKLIKCKLLFHLDLINNCNVKMFTKRSSVINSIYSGQQQFSYTKCLSHENILELFIYFRKGELLGSVTACPALVTKIKLGCTMAYYAKS